MSSRLPANDGSNASGTPRDRFDLDGMVAVVTGALGLIGREHCRALAQAGAHVVVADLDGAGCTAFAHELTSRVPGAPEALGNPVDVTRPESIQALRDKVLARFGRIHALVADAAIDDKVEAPSLALEASRFETYPLERWRRSLDVNVTGTFLCAQILGTEMARAGRGSIVTVASTYGLVAPDQSLYRGPDGEQRFFKSPSYPTGKGAILSFTRYLAAYWGHAGVRVNALCPGGVENGQDEHFVATYAKRTPLGRMAKVSDYAGAVVFLVSDASAYMTGSALVVDGGFTAW